MEVDSRPSDALALAVRVEAPIYVEEAVLDKAGILLDQETGKPMSQVGQEMADKDKKPSEEELKKMSAFYDFINTLDLEDFDNESIDEDPFMFSVLQDTVPVTKICVMMLNALLLYHLLHHKKGNTESCHRTRLQQQPHKTIVIPSDAESLLGDDEMRYPIPD